MREPSERADAHDGAALKQCIEQGVVLCSAIVLAEDMLLEEQLSQLMQAAAPRQELMCSTLRDIAYGIMACCLKGGCRLTDAVGVLLAAAALEDECWLECCCGLGGLGC